jgi:DNA-binding Lrp family transcriptional regulator
MARNIPGGGGGSRAGSGGAGPGATAAGGGGVRGLDAIDVRILAALQREGRITIVRLAEQVGLSARPCLERVRRLEAAGIIAGYRAEVAIERLTQPVTIFAEVALERHDRRRQDIFERRIAMIEEAVEIWEVSGAFDYLVRFVCRDLDAYHALTSALLEDEMLGLARIVSTITLRPVRRFAGYPTSLIDPAQRESG